MFVPVVDQDQHPLMPTTPARARRWIKRGTLVLHPKWGKATVGGTMDGKLSLHNPETNKRLTQGAKVAEYQPLKLLRWRTRLVPLHPSPKKGRPVSSQIERQGFPQVGFYECDGETSQQGGMALEQSVNQV